VGDSEKIKQLKRDILQASFDAGACHISSALSCIRIVNGLFDKIREGDRFIFAKASGACALYVVLADRGFFPKEKVAEYLKQYPLASKEVPGVLHSVGSLGHGLSVAAGLALADRTRDVYVLLSDAELQEGSTMEAALFIKQHNLQNLYVIVDDNSMQACGMTEEILRPDWSLFETLPNFERVRTVKGEGVDFMQDWEWHYKNLTPELLEKALNGL
jgi:transketolase